METLSELLMGLRPLIKAFPVEIALTLGIFFFALSWVRPRRIVSLPASSRRARTLVSVGITGALSILAVATVSSWLSYLYSFPDISGYDGWWRRPAPLITTALVLALAARALRAEPLPAPGERAIAPRRRWWVFTPRVLLWVTASLSALLFITSIWQTLIGVSAPRAANHYGSVPHEYTELPIFMTMQGGMGYVAGAGWPNHLAVLTALALTAAALILTLAHDANRPIHVRASAVEVREERVATARMLLWLALGGILLTLGAVWAHTGFIGEIIVGVFEDNGQNGAVDDAERYVVGTGYQDFAGLMHKGGYVVQGLGAAVLMRLAVDTWRARRALEQASGVTDSPADSDQRPTHSEQQS